MKQLVTILGPTACGKTALAAQLALKCDGEIISADSRQVYRRMDIGTGKDLDDYHIEGHDIPYHLIDICEPGTKYNLFEYQRDFLSAYNDIQERGKQPILCGGTGLYLESVLRGYQLSPVPQNQSLRDSLEGKSLEELTKILERLKKEAGTCMHNTTDVDSPQRAIRAIEIETYNLQHPTQRRQFPAIPSIIFGLSINRETRRLRISQRLRQRLENGMVDEIKQILASGATPDDLMYYGLEYKFVTLYVIGQLSYEQMEHDLEIAIHQFAKRQMTWFRGMERRGLHIHWIDASQPLTQSISQILSFL
jgi:tRNA dimethylallyltransferase